MRTLLPLYLLGAVFYFAIAFSTFKQDKYLYPEQKRFSWMILIVVTLLWFLVVPISLLLEGNTVSQE